MILDFVVNHQFQPAVFQSEQQTLLGNTRHLLRRKKTANKPKPSMYGIFLPTFGLFLWYM